ncbi:MAG: PIN domain-containing protein [Clostridiales bacterium]|nr:PIN domain-containing protein [Clostridiales bacterium]
MRYALDTNTIIRFLRDDPFVRQKFDAAVARGDEIIIPPLVHYEIRRGFLCKSVPKRENSYYILTERCPVGEVSAKSLELGARIYADLYKAKRTVADMDLLIAAFCIAGGCTLVTGNVRHFEVINGLMFEDWAAGS